MLSFYDIDTQRLYQFQAKGLTMRDERESARDRLKISKRRESETIDDVELLHLYNMLTLRYGHREFRFTLLEEQPTEGDTLPPETEWHTVDMSDENSFWELPEQFVIYAVAEVMDRNPHLSMEFPTLKKTHDILTQTTPDTADSQNSNASEIETASPPDEK